MSALRLASLAYQSAPIFSAYSGNGVQSFFAAAGNDDRFLDFNVVDGTADKSGEGEIQKFASEFQ